MDFPPPNNAQYFDPSNISTNPSTTDFPPNNPNYQPILPQIMNNNQRWQMVIYIHQTTKLIIIII